MSKILAKIFGTRNSRMLASLKPILSEIDSFGDTLKDVDDVTLQSYTERFKESLANGKTLDDILPQAFAVVREASSRVLGLRHFQVQLIGGIALHKGWIAEAKTGEGKTLMATLPSYLNALSGKGVHVIVPNAYLASRDAEWMGKIHQFLGLSVAAIHAETPQEEKQQLYQSDIIYTTNHALGFDYLRDNMRVDDSQKMIRELNYCIVDEVDSILIDEARTPLIITGPSDTSSELYAKIYQIIDKLSVATEEVSGDVEINLKDKQVFLSETGQEKVQTILSELGLIVSESSLFDLENTNISHYISACLQGKHLFHRDVEYVVNNQEIVIIDSSTGRKATGRRWGNGIHQAIEAKEAVTIQKETQTLASITYQNLFRQYDKLSGMTGTADTEAAELKDIYGLEVLVIPPNKPLARIDMPDVIYLVYEEKTKAIIAEVKKRHKTQQPLLIGTASIEYSEQLSQLLTQEGIKHKVLNAKHHEKEAEIIADAGRINAVTIATNMAGRGTDIVLGGCPNKHSDWEAQHAAVIKAGGLHVLGTERHESRRIDNQLRGRAGRQGDVGSSQFFLSFDDTLIKRFASEKIRAMLKSLGEPNEPISAPILTRSIENAQKNVESKYYDARRELLKLDDVANHQRHIVYEQRNELLATEDVSELIEGMLQYSVTHLSTLFLPNGEDSTTWNISGLTQHLATQYGINADLSSYKTRQALEDTLTQLLEAIISEKKQQTTDQHFQLIEKRTLLIILDKCWKEHLAAMDHLKKGINFRSYAQKNPTHEFKKDSFILFEQMLEKIKINTILHLCKVTFEPAKKPAIMSGGYAINLQPKKREYETTAS